MQKLWSVIAEAGMPTMRPTHREYLPTEIFSPGQVREIQKVVLFRNGGR